MKRAVSIEDIGGELATSRRSLIVETGLRLVREKYLGFWGGVIPIVILTILAVFAPQISQYDPYAQDASIILQPPSFSHWLGTDQFGRDVFARVAYGARISLWVGFASVFLGVSLASVVGLVSGAFGGWVDFVIQRIIDMIMAFPSFVLILLIAALLDPGQGNTILAIGVVLFAGASRVIRGEVLGVKERTYIDAAKVAGCTYTRIIWRHILPNIVHVIVVVMSINVAFAIILTASLSFLGLGVPPPTPTWGGMVTGSQIAYLVDGPWIVAGAAGALAIAVYSFNMFGDALRDLLDPRLRGM